MLLECGVWPGNAFKLKHITWHQMIIIPFHVDCCILQFVYARHACVQLLWLMTYGLIQMRKVIVLLSFLGIIFEFSVISHFSRNLEANSGSYKYEVMLFLWDSGDRSSGVLWDRREPLMWVASSSCVRIRKRRFFFLVTELYHFFSCLLFFIQPSLQFFW